MRTAERSSQPCPVDGRRLVWHGHPIPSHPHPYPGHALAVSYSLPSPAVEASDSTARNRVSLPKIPKNQAPCWLRPKGPMQSCREGTLLRASKRSGRLRKEKKSSQAFRMAKNQASTCDSHKRRPNWKEWAITWQRGRRSLWACLSLSLSQFPFPTATPNARPIE